MAGSTATIDRKTGTMRFRAVTRLEKTELQLAPMIDIVFLLLIFFLITWSYARFETELDISVPAAEQGATPERQVGEIIVNVNAAGEIFVNSVKQTDAELLEKLNRLVRFRDNQAVILRGDGAVPYDQIVKVLDICYSAKIRNVAFATNRPKPKEPASN
jgi:biopolymer transport protein ExbD